MRVNDESSSEEACAAHTHIQKCSVENMTRLNAYELNCTGTMGELRGVLFLEVYDGN
jgi:hypothetical protein